MKKTTHKADIDVKKSWAYYLWTAIIYKKYYGQCIVCGSPANDAHHIFPKGAYPHMKLDINNGVMLCRDHHDAYHSKQDINVLQAIIEAIGQKEYKKLKLLSQQNIKVNEKWLDKQIKILETAAKHYGILDLT